MPPHFFLPPPPVLDFIRSGFFDKKKGLRHFFDFCLKLFDYVFDLINKEVKAQEYQKEVERDPLGL